MKKYPALLLPLLLFFLSGCAPLECSTCTRVLFVGNSFTSANNLPNVFAQLAASGGYAVETKLLAPKGWSLSDHAQSAALQNALGQSRWDYAVLQEKDEIAASEQARIELMHPAARTLAGQIRAAGASPIFFQTWARRDSTPDFESAQFQIDAGYAGIADELGVLVAPVGDAWFAALNQNPELSLWQEDGIQPSAQGTYLAACVLYAVLFNASPAGLSYFGNLSAETAAQLQNVAAQSVLP